MPERIIINGVPVDVPVAVESDGRAAVQRWYDEQIQTPSAIVADAPTAQPADDIHTEE